MYLYSNLHLKDTPFVPFTKDLLTRVNVRPGLNSIGLLDEYSLVCDQNIYGKEHADIVEEMRDFWKLCRHEGFKRFFVNSQTIASINHTLKDVIGSYYFIHSRINLPFFSIIRIREMSYSRDVSAGMINDTAKDIEDTTKLLIVPKYIFKKYDSRAYSILTDSLPVLDNEIIIKKRKDLKMKNLVSFMQLNYLYRNIEKEGEKNGQ